MLALVRGEVDAICSSGASGLYLCESLGAKEVIELGNHCDPEISGGNQQPAALTVSARLVRERPDLVARYLKQVMRAAKWAETHRRETIQVIANEVGTAYEWADLAYGPDAHLRLCPALTDEMVLGLERQKAFLLEHGFIESDFDLRGWIDRSPLQRATRDLR